MMSTPSTINRRDFVKTAGALVLAASVLGPPAFGQEAISQEPRALSKPNVIFILADDQGWGDLNVYGHPYLKTPNLDRLAAEGTRFAQFHVNATVCSPSRTAFMTGHFPARHKVHGHFDNHKVNEERDMPDWLDPDVTTVTDLVKSAGYVIGHFGKWHLCWSGEKTAPSPGAYGIDDHRTIVSNSHGWRNDNFQPSEFLPRSTDLFVDEAIRFIQAHKDESFYFNHFQTLRVPSENEWKEIRDLRILHHNPISRSHLNETGIRLTGDDCIVRNSVFSHSAGAGIVATGRNCLIENNYLKDMNYQGTEAGAIITTYYSNGARILRNTLWRSRNAGTRVPAGVPRPAGRSLRCPSR
jgi:N-acetylgalactosamine-6-sulfatase